MLQISSADEMIMGHSCNCLNSKMKTIFKVCREMLASSCPAIAGDHSCMPVRLLSSMKDAVLGWAPWMFWVLCWQLLLNLML